VPVKKIQPLRKRVVVRIDEIKLKNSFFLKKWTFQKGERGGGEGETTNKQPKTLKKSLNNQRRGKI